jgi:hypothetical protein
MGKFGAAMDWGVTCGGAEAARISRDAHHGSPDATSATHARKCVWWLPALIMTARVSHPRHLCPTLTAAHRCSGIPSPQPAT